MTLAAGLTLALLSTAALSYGFYLQHAASGQAPTLSLRHPAASLASLFRNWRWLAGFATGLAGWGLYIAALRLAPLSLVRPPQPPTSRCWPGSPAQPAPPAPAGQGRGRPIGRRPGAARPVAARRHPAPGRPRLADPARLGGGLSPARRPRRRPGSQMLKPGAGLAAAAGLLYAAGDVATKAAVAGTRPALAFAGLLLACSGLAFVSLQLAFQRGTVLATAGVSTLLTNAVPILADVIVFSEHLPGGAAGIARGTGFAATVLGATLLAAKGQPGPADAPAKSPDRVQT